MNKDSRFIKNAYFAMSLAKISFVLSIKYEEYLIYGYYIVVRKRKS